MRTWIAITIGVGLALPVLGVWWMRRRPTDRRDRVSDEWRGAQIRERRG